MIWKLEPNDNKAKTYFECVIFMLRAIGLEFFKDYGEFTVSLSDYNSIILKIKGEYVKTSGKIYDILECLIRSRNIIVSKEQIFNKIWGLDSETVITVIEV